MEAVGGEVAALPTNDFFFLIIEGSYISNPQFPCLFYNQADVVGHTSLVFNFFPFFKFVSAGFFSTVWYRSAREGKMYRIN